MFSSINESENVRRGEEGGMMDTESDEGEGDEGLKKMFLIPFLGIGGTCSKKTV